MPTEVPDSKSGVIVRPMTRDDIAPCAAIVGETPLWREHYGISTGRAEVLFENAFDRKEGLFVAVEGETVIGFAWFIARSVFGRSGYLKLIGVRADKRNGQAGAELLRAVEGAAGDDLFILVSDFNADALRFYLRHGYAEVGRLPGYVLPGVAEIVLWRRKA